MRTGGGEKRTGAPPPAPGDAPFLLPLLVALTAVGPVSFQVFLPAMPGIQAGFGVEHGTAQLALSLSMAGIAAATLTYGGLADRFGRRRTLLGGMALLLLGSLVCATAPHIVILIAGRILQAAGGASGMVVTRAIVLDLHGRDGAGRVMANLMAAMVVAPMLATPLGGLITDHLGWRANFLAVTAAALAMLLLVWRLLPETRAVAAAGDGRASGLLDSYATLIRAPGFAAFAFQGAFGMAAFMAFVTAAPYFFADTLGLSATAYGSWTVVVSAGFMAGSLIASRVPPERLGLEARVLAGSALALAAALAALGLALAGVWTVWSLIGPATVLALANGLGMPSAQAGAVAAVPRLAGTASGLSGFLGTVIGAVAVQTVGSLQDGTPYPMVVAMALASGAALAAAAFLPRGRTVVAPA